MYYTTKISKFRHLAKRKAPWSESRGPDRFRSQSRRLRLAATGRGAGGAVLSHVVRTDVDGLGCGLFHELDAGRLGVGTGYAVGLAFGGFDDQVNTAVVGEGLVQLEGEGLTLAHEVVR